MFASCVAMLLWTNNVRTNTVLVGATTWAMWHLAAFRLSGGRDHFVLGFIGVGLALLAKGPIGAAVPLLALASDAALKRDWRWLLSWRWLAGAAIGVLVISPMLWGLYRQFGLKGWQFFFWEQSFGRITGSSSWRDTTTPFLLHSHAPLGASAVDASVPRWDSP